MTVEDPGCCRFTERVAAVEVFEFPRFDPIAIIIKNIIKQHLFASHTKKYDFGS